MTGRPDADVIVVGAGVAGATTALLLGRAGVTVELYDQHRFPREKACAEGLMPAGAAVLARLGLLDQIAGARFHGIRYRGFGGCVEARFPASAAGAGFAARRLHLDGALFAAARATPGVTAREDARVEGPIVEAGRVRGVRVDGAERRARVVVGADGPRSMLRRQLGLDPAAARTPRIGLRRHFRLAAGKRAPDHVEIFLAGGREIYVTALPENEISLALLTDRAAVAGQADDFYTRAIDEHERLRDLLEGATATSELAGRTPLGGRARRTVLPGLVLIGDAAAALDPVTGAGMAQALQSAELLAEALVRPTLAGVGRFDPSDDVLVAFDHRRRALYRDAAALTRLVLTLVRHPPLARGAFHVLPRWPALFSHLVGVAAGTRPFVPI